jgi:hypothetical protein
LKNIYEFKELIVTHELNENLIDLSRIDS